MDVSEPYIEQLKNDISQLKERIQKYSEQLKELKQSNDEYQFKIRAELEPRIEAEKDSYDFSISCDTGAEDCDSFEYHVNCLIDLIKDNPAHFEWENKCGNMYEKILYYLKEMI